MNANRLYIVCIVALFLSFAAVFVFLPRSKYSELEKRDLAEFPAYSAQKLAKGEFTKDISTWFSDTEPYRDKLMTFSMFIKDKLKLKTGSDNITFHAADDEEEAAPVEEENGEIGEYTNNITANAKAKIAHKGIIVVGSGDDVRALMAYGGGPDAALGYAKVVNEFHHALGDGVNVYAMIIPTAVEFYCPDQMKSRIKEQRLTIQNCYAKLEDGVKGVDAYTSLSQHVDEPIYLRTDHHWAPLGGYYAAQKFAQVAGVPFADLSRYDRHVVKGYVGSMFAYSKDIAVKNAPEDFVYYTPRDLNYTTTYTQYRLDKSYNVIGENAPVQGQYFLHYPDGSGGAYCTFMGGDNKIVKVQTGLHTGRRVAILKDSFGNTVPGYLFFSFDEVHVIDFRYFTPNFKDYVRENHITDVLFANNSFSVCSPSTWQAYRQFLKN